EAVRAGKLAVANVPGNGVADDKATYRYVPEMIRFYLGEEPVLDAVPTWLLADDADLAAVRDRLHELVIKPVDGYGGQGVVFGPLCSAAELAALRAEVLAAPHRFVAQEPVDFSTAPTLVGGRLVPRHVDLRVFSVAGRTTEVLPSPLTRVALTEGSLLVNSSQGGGSKDTWVLSAPLHRASTLPPEEPDERAARAEIPAPPRPAVPLRVGRVPTALMPKKAIQRQQDEQQQQTAPSSDPAGDAPC
ncbi:MAG: circularly permuted type 2 ATP-grasp protein, partial [Friedmanniella sp.]